MRIKLSVPVMLVYLMVSLLLIFLAGSCSTPSGVAPSPPANVATISDKSGEKAEWETEWQKTLEKARKEGSVTVYSTAGSDVRNAFIEAFPKATGIKMEFVTGRSGQITAKIITEKNAGIDMVDIYTGGLNTVFDDLRSKGFLQPIKPALILPEVLDPNMWMDKKLPFADINNDTVFSFRANPGGWSVVINTTQVKKEDISSYYDLLNPKWKGKITISDVTTSGGGQKWFSMSYLFYGLNQDFMKQLAKQEPYMSRDERQHVEWVARGKYPIGIAPSSDAIAEFRSVGAPILEISPKEEKQYISTGGGNVVLMNKAAHPNAAKIFINWLLSKEGQTVFSRARQDASARIDVPTDHLPVFKVRDPKATYLIVDREDVMADPRWADSYEKAREIFGPLIK